MHRGVKIRECDSSEVSGNIFLLPVLIHASINSHLVLRHIFAMLKGNIFLT
jgi:hypothetical protein